MMTALKFLWLVLPAVESVVVDVLLLAMAPMYVLTKKLVVLLVLVLVVLVLVVLVLVLVLVPVVKALIHCPVTCSRSPPISAGCHFSSDHSTRPALPR